ncbi:MAG: hypothetical protein GEV13_33535 [Rhodospirillales bacterium]|nr:hypothetical protein [Rhodospirillales bacterium]
MAGSAVPATSYPEVEEARARANGPYQFTAGLSASFNGDHQAPDTDYLWRSGNGQLLAGLDPSHAYPRRGLYVAELTSLDNQWGVEVRTRHLAAVRVLNTPPALGPLPVLHANEGEEVELTVTFSDRAWLDPHRAFVDFGDDNLPVEAEVTETLGPPQTTGRLTATHTYCDNGTFTVTVILQDQQGGTARETTEAIIVNLPPVAEAGEDVFAHPCAPLRLVGYFEDPGWCDTHTGHWDFGDCSPLFPATIIETNLPPKATGYAIATHCYKKCGVFLAKLTIRDDDGAEGSDTLVVRYSDLLNGGFESGFQHVPLGMVGNHWTPYAQPLSSSVPVRDVFSCQSCVVCSGAKAQALHAPGFPHAGILQSIGANPGWEYQFVADVSLQPPGEGGVWLGVDPAGGTNRQSAGVVWSSVAPGVGWQRVSVRAVAEARSVTVFLEVRNAGAEAAVFDCIQMQAYPCSLELDPKTPPNPVRRCVSWLRIDPIPQLGPQTEREGFTFSSLTGADLSIITFGTPHNGTKLGIPDFQSNPNGPDGLRVDWEGEASKIEITVIGAPGSRILLTALNAQGESIGEDSATQGDVRTLEVSTQGIAAAEIRSDYRGGLIELCIEQGPGRDSSDCGCQKRRGGAITTAR